MPSFHSDKELDKTYLRIRPPTSSSLISTSNFFPFPTPPALTYIREQGHEVDVVWRSRPFTFFVGGGGGSGIVSIYERGTTI